MVSAIGLDIGGTKCEVQLFDEAWQVIAKKRLPTAPNYDQFLSDLDALICWGQEREAQKTEHTSPVGLSFAGLITAQGVSFSANLPSSGQQVVDDLMRKRPNADLFFINDCRALALSEAVFGAGREAQRSVGLILGTGVGAGITHGGALLLGPSGTAGELGHTAVGADILARHDLPVLECGCGRKGCFECYCSGPGLSALLEVKTGHYMSAQQIVALLGKDVQVDEVWRIWKDVVGELLFSIVQYLDPDMIILAGGLSKISHIDEQLQGVLDAKQFEGFATPKVVLAQGGDASGARGAAYHARQMFLAPPCGSEDRQSDLS